MKNIKFLAVVTMVVATCIIDVINANIQDEAIVAALADELLEDAESLVDAEVAAME